MDKFPADFNPKNVIEAIEKKEKDDENKLRLNVYNAFSSNKSYQFFKVNLDGFDKTTVDKIDAEVKDHGFKTEYIGPSYFSNEEEPAKLKVISK